LITYTTVAAALCTALSISTASAQYTPVWFDGYDISGGNPFDVNFEYTTRQFGTLAPILYTANTFNPANDYRHQLFGPGNGPLQLAGDGGSPAPAPTMVSPTFNFNGTVGAGIVGRQVSLSLDVGAFILNNTGGSYVTAGLTVGSSASLAPVGSAGSGFGVLFVEDTYGGGGNFIQLFDGNSWLGNFANPGGAGWANVQLNINDLSDNNPWDGIGSTTIDLFVNSLLVGSFTKGSGGYTDNFITLQGDRDFNGNDLAVHLYDGLTVYAAPVPEPSTFALAGLGCAALVILRRRIS
jgi:hypothetical protein